MTQEKQQAEVAKQVTELTQEEPLQVSRIHRRTDGGVDVLISLSKEQSYVLINFALTFLAAQGLVLFTDIDETGEEIPSEAEGVEGGPEVVQH